MNDIQTDNISDINPNSREPKASNDKNREKKQPIWRVILDYVIIVVVAFLIALFLTKFIIINCQVPTGSMETTIMTGDRVIGWRLSYTFGEPKRGDIAIFYAPQSAIDESGRFAGKKYGDVLYIKRVVGLPGDTIEVRNNRIYINGSASPLDEPYLDDNNLGTCRLSNTKPYKLGEDEYFMMGDNRDNSLDSRSWGPVKRKDIIAKAVFSYWPFSDMKWLATSYDYNIS